MRRVLVPLDGTPFAEAILSDAIRLAGDSGELLLARDANEIRYEASTGTFRYRETMGEAEGYLKDLAQRLRRAVKGVSVRHLVVPDVPDAIDPPAGGLRTDFIAFGVQGREPVRHYLAGSAIWRVLRQSPAPILMRHIGGRSAYQPPTDTRIMVPVNGAAVSRDVVLLAADLARERAGTLWLVTVVDGERGDARHLSQPAPTLEERLTDARNRLRQLAERLDVPSHLHVLPGPPIAELLADMARYWDVSEVVIAGQLRIEPDRLTAGPIADYLMAHLRCPIIVRPHCPAAPSPGEDEPLPNW